MKKLFVALVILSTSVTAQANIIDDYIAIYDDLSAMCFQRGQQSGLIVRVLATQSSQVKESDKRKMMANLEFNASHCGAEVPDWAYVGLSGELTKPLEEKKVLCFAAGKEVAILKDKIADSTKRGARTDKLEEAIRIKNGLCNRR
ncbi:hypothetical protein D3C87_1628400 [compost metagenome]